VASAGSDRYKLGERTNGRAMLLDDKIFLGTSTRPEYLALTYANRHGLVTGATGTGKTVTLQIMAEGFSRAGVPVFCADVKGDLSGIAMAGMPQDSLTKRAKQIGFDDYKNEAFPTIFWDLFGNDGHPVRTTVSEMGPLLLGRILGLNDTQTGVLNIAFKYADDNGLLLLDLKDLRALLVALNDNAKAVSTQYGNVATATIGAVQRALLVIEQQGGDRFFGEKALAISDLMRIAPDGRGYVSVLAAGTLMQSPQLYATFLLWLMSELFEALPEVGDPDKPKLVFFFDEAHLLFDGAPKALLDKIEQVVKLIRSKGVGIYFVTQNPLDIPESVLAQLGNRVQHALRAYTPREQQAVKVAADTFRPNPAFSTAEVISQLGIGEALVSVLEDKGIPSMVGRTLIRPPSSRMGPITPGERAQIMAASPVGSAYDTPVDRESAYEVLTRKTTQETAAAPAPKAPAGRASTRESWEEAAVKSFTRAMASSAGRQVMNAIGKELVRGVLGGLLRR
jgi:uncharacterized protein